MVSLSLLLTVSIMYLEKLVIDNIKRIRKEKGFSQEKLAEACSTATSYIGLMETYRNVPKLSTIEKIARALDVDPLVFFKDPKKIPPNMKKKQTEKRKSCYLLSLKKLISFFVIDCFSCGSANYHSLTTQAGALS